MSLELEAGDFPGSPVVKTSPPNAWAVGSNPGQEAKIPPASWQKKKVKQINIVTNSIKTLNDPHFLKSLKKQIRGGKNLRITY